MFPLHPPRPAPRAAPGLLASFAAALLGVAATARPAAAQTDYYNTDAGRPITIEDAYAVERRAVELQVAPLRLARSRGGAYRWGVEPELAVGILPRTQLEVGLPLAFVDAGGRTRSGLAGVEVSVLHNLNVETAIPAFGVAAHLLVPAGGQGPRSAYASLKGIATRTFTRARVHVNGEYTLGARASGEGAAELSRWQAGAAVDRPFPLRSLLVTGELVARQPLAADDRVEWSTGAGTRYQVSPRVAADAGGGYRLTGDDRGWFATVGAAVVVGMPWGRR